jgi:hypothetical protein
MRPVRTVTLVCSGATRVAEMKRKYQEAVYPTTLTQGVAAATALLVVACAEPTYKPQPPAPPPPQARLIGMSKAALTACAGTPGQTSAKGDIEYVTYVTGTRPAAKAQPAPPTASSTATGGPGYCRATFALRRNIVESITFAGTSLTDLAINPDCMRMLNKCLAVR